MSPVYILEIMSRLLIPNTKYNINIVYIHILSIFFFNIHFFHSNIMFLTVMHFHIGNSFWLVHSFFTVLKYEIIKVNINDDLLISSPDMEIYVLVPQFLATVGKAALLAHVYNSYGYTCKSLYL